MNCLSCRAGTYSNVSAATKCEACPPGTYSQAKASFCVKCGPGTGLGSWKNGCFPCDAGYYNDGSLKYCQVCPSGTSANKGKGATKCVSCPKGTYRDMRYVTAISYWKCPRCRRNTYSNVEGATQCQLCPLGTVSDKGATECKPCPAGTYRSRILRTNCIACDAETTSEPGSAGCKHTSKGCSFDTFEDSSGACKACLPGERFDTATKTCIRCADDEASRGGAVTECTKCTGNTSPVSSIYMTERSLCICKLGYYETSDGTCIPCEPGSYGTEQPRETIHSFLYRHPTTRSRDCFYCNPGFSDKPGSLSCKVCPSNTISDPDSPSFCERCPKGFRTDPEESFLDNGSLRNPHAECYSPRDNCGPTEVRNGFACKPKVKCPGSGGLDEMGICQPCYGSEYWDQQNQKCRQCRNGGNPWKYHNLTTCARCPPHSSFSSIDEECVCDYDYVLAENKRCEKCPPRLVVGSNNTCVKCVNGVTRYDGGRYSWHCSDCKGNSYLPKGAT